MNCTVLPPEAISSLAREPVVPVLAFGVSIFRANGTFSVETCDRWQRELNTRTHLVVAKSPSERPNCAGSHPVSEASSLCEQGPRPDTLAGDESASARTELETCTHLDVVNE